ncbi:MAG: outer membrane beta-barrel protein [Bacteroidaceae bacterium]|nr:outer membrane beta-barrel protein [Bacteroidaceae bacterium]
MRYLVGRIGLLLLGLFLCLARPLHADELEYRYELGGMAGGSFYLGDANYSSLFKNMNLMGGVVWRYNLNLRMALKANLAVAGISGATADFDNRFPGGETEFSRTIYDLGAQFEYNFFAYGSGGGYKRTHRLTPYVSAGLGFTFAPEPVDNVFTVNIPLGVGVKYKFAPRFNLGCEFSFRFTLSDKLDVTENKIPYLDDPYGIKSSGIKNKDSYTFFAIFLTYDLSPKYRECNN